MRVLEQVRVAVLAADGFELGTLLESLRTLVQSGARVRVLSPEGGQIFGASWGKRGTPVESDALKLEDLENYDALVLISGEKSTGILRESGEVLEFIRKAQAEGKGIAAIGDGLELLVGAGIVSGRTVSSDARLRAFIEGQNGKWVDAQVMVEGNWVTSRRSSDLPAFTREMVSLFARIGSLDFVADKRKGHGGMGAA